MDRPWLARSWHAATCVVAVFALVTQTVLAVAGASVLVEENPPGLAERMIRLVGYFTIQANLLVAVAVFPLVRDPGHDGRVWRVLRAAGLVGIAVTGIVHWLFLRPLLDLTGWSALCDLLLHVVVPLLTVVGWLLFGPRPRVTLRAAAVALSWPVAWLAYTLVRGAVTGFYPYPFLDVQRFGAASVAGSSIGVTVVFVVLTNLLGLGDRRLPARPPRS